MTTFRLSVAALLAGAMMTGPALAHEPWLCPTASTEATTADQNLIAAVARVFMARWLRFATIGTRADPNSGAHIVTGFDCADLTINTGERFKLYRLEKTSTYQLDTASGEMLGQISFDKLSASYFVQYDSAYIVIHGLPGAVCDGPAILKMNVWQAQYAPGRCLHQYASVGDNTAPALVIAAMRYIFSNLTAPAVVPQSF